MDLGDAAKRASSALQIVSSLLANPSHSLPENNAFHFGGQSNQHTFTTNVLMHPSSTLAAQSSSSAMPTLALTPTATPTTTQVQASTSSTLPTSVSTVSDLGTFPGASGTPPSTINVMATSSPQSPSTADEPSGGVATVTAAVPTSAAPPVLGSLTTATPAVAIITSSSSLLTITTALVEKERSTTYTVTSTLVETSAVAYTILPDNPTNLTASPSLVPQGIGSQPPTPGASRTTRPNTAHHSSIAVILGTSISGSVLVIVVIFVCVYLVKRRYTAGGRRGRAASRNESFFAPERPLVSPFPTLSRPQSHATATSVADTLSDEERWAEYRNVYQSPSLLPNTGFVSRDTLLVDHQTEPISPPPRTQNMEYAILSRSSPHSATFPHEQQSPSPSRGMLLFPENTNSVLTNASSSSPSASASFSQYLVYDGIDIGSVTETVATPSGQRVPVAVTNSYGDDDYLPSPNLLSSSPRGSSASLRSVSSVRDQAIDADETYIGMAI